MRREGAGRFRGLTVPIAVAIATVAALPSTAHAVTVVSLSISRVIVTVDPAQQSNLSIEPGANGRVLIRDTGANVQADPGLEPGSCTTTAVVVALECNLQQRVTIDVIDTGQKQAVDTINASTSPKKLWLGVSGATNTAVNVTGSAFNDTINASSLADDINGGPGADSLTGGAGADQVSGGADTDTIHYDDHPAGVTVTVGNGAANDGNAQDGPAGARDNVKDGEELVATGGDDALTGDASNNQLRGGGGDDTLIGGAGDDLLDGGAGTNTASYADHAAGVVVNLVDPAADGAPGEQDTLPPGLIQYLVGGAGADVLVGDAGVNDIRGGASGDVIIGGAGPDRLYGEAGADDMRAEDQETDTVDCGPDADKATLDDIDVALNCDDATVTVVDRDGDGAPAAIDCNDFDPAIRPGAVDVPGDGIDQNCDGVDARVDADGDGIFREQDCDDANAAIKPGALEVVGNSVDENCDGVAAPYPKLDVGFRYTFSVFSTYTRIDLLSIRTPVGSTIRAACRPPRAPARARKGCPFRTLTKKATAPGKAVSLTAPFAGRKVLAGTVLKIRVTAPGAIGRIAKFTFRSKKRPRLAITCKTPEGARVAC